MQRSSMHAYSVPQGADFQAHKPVVLVFEGINGPAVIVLNGVVRVAKCVLELASKDMSCVP
jgi:hypothetical protein